MTTDVAYLSEGMNTSLQKEWNYNLGLVKNNPDLASCNPAHDDNDLANDIANLYYVAFSRARFYTGNAKMISKHWVTDKEEGVYPGEHIDYNTFMSYCIDSQKIDIKDL